MPWYKQLRLFSRWTKYYYSDKKNDKTYKASPRQTLRHPVVLLVFEGDDVSVFIRFWLSRWISLDEVFERLFRLLAGLCGIRLWLSGIHTPFNRHDKAEAILCLHTEAVISDSGVRLGFFLAELYMLSGLWYSGEALAMKGAGVTILHESPEASIDWSFLDDERLSLHDVEA